MKKKFSLEGMHPGDSFLGCPKCFFQFGVGTITAPVCPECGTRMDVCKVTEEDKEPRMEINGEKKEAYVRAAEESIYDWAKSVGFPVEAVVKTAIYSQLKSMYDVGFRHCDNAWEEYMEDMRIERDFSERD